MKVLALLILTQNLNVTPIESRQDGVRVPQRVVQRQYAIDCRANMTCAVDGGVLYLSAAAGSGGGYDGGKVAEAYAADASITAQMFDHDPSACPAGEFASDQSAAGVLTCSTPPGTGVTSVSGSTFVASSGGLAPAISLNAAGTPSGTTFLRGDNTWATPSGGGGSANFSADTATFAGKSDALKTVTAAWVSGASNIICTADGEEASVEGAQFVVISKASGSFVVRGYVLQGVRTGATPFTCTGN